MKIGIDGTPLNTPYPTGTRYYAESLLNSLSKIDKSNDYFIFSIEKTRIPNQKNFHWIKIPKLPILKKQLLLPLLTSRYNLDVFHFLEPFGSVFLKHPKIITTVHDLDLDKTYPYNSRHIIKRIYCEITRKLLLNNSTLFITDTKSIKSELVSYLKNHKHKSVIKVIPLSFKKIFILNKAHNKLNSKNKKTKFFLCMGDFSWRKNVNTIFEAYAHFDQDFRKKYELKVVVSTKKVAERFKALVRRYSISNTTKIIISPTDNELKNLYQSAICFLYPSLYEGFGLPILEAMASGCPVITSNYGAMREVAGKAAILVNPRSERSIFKAMINITKNKLISKSYIDKGLKRSSEFNAKETAIKTINVYKNVMMQKA